MDGGNCISLPFVISCSFLHLLQPGKTVPCDTYIGFFLQPHDVVVALCNDDVWSFDPYRLDTVSLGKAPEKHKGTEAVCALPDGRLLCIGRDRDDVKGEDPCAHEEFRHVSAFDPLVGSWREFPMLQHTRLKCAVTCAGDQVVVVGGFLGSDKEELPTVSACACPCTSRQTRLSRRAMERLSKMTS
eukprot:TRINITY_DN16852_c0_g1_i8.p1 TRINITY_DN16852_c0_g1~~TRINITY_DN16852_c0_g1_i8.p1  ORF type:complete len:186 (-),score=17.66 TRINITY_DN16852_c0_g1_i8:212-769(-)